MNESTKAPTDDDIIRLLWKVVRSTKWVCITWLAQKSVLNSSLFKVSNSAILRDLCRRGQYSVQSSTDNHVE